LDQFGWLLTGRCVVLCSDDAAKFREDLMNIARTTLSSKILTQYKDHFANLAVTAVLRLKVSEPAEVFTAPLL